MEKVGHCEWTLRFYSPATLPVCCLLPVLPSWKEMEESQQDAPTIMGCLQCLPLRDGLELWAKINIALC